MARCHFTNGQFDLMAVGQLLPEHDTGGLARRLSEVRLHTGFPDSAKQPESHGARMRRPARWTDDGCTLIHEPLRHP